MATVHLTSDRLAVRFTLFEKVLGLVRDVDVPLSAVTAAAVESDGLTAARGLRAPGLGVPGVRKLGTYRARTSKTLVSVRAGQPALAVRLRGQRYDGLLIGLDDARAYAERLTVSG